MLHAPSAECWRRNCFVLVVTAILIQYSYTDDFKTERWKRQNCRRNQFECDSGGCVDVFHLCDGTVHCNDGSDEIVSVCEGRRCHTQAFQCAYGACIDKVLVCDGIKNCADGSDELPEKCRTSGLQPESSVAFLPPPQIGASPQITCPPLMNPSLEISCELNNNRVDCEKPVLPGTLATVSCNQFYTSTEFSQINTICEQSGKWSRKVMPCSPRCGEPNPDGLPFIYGGYEAKFGEFPWHVGVYKLTPDGNLQQICGGNIISERVIVTASHCFWDDTNSKKADPSLFRIAVGKYYREWSKQDKYEQKKEIGEIILHNRFRGGLRKWQNDIAVVILKEDIHMTLAVRPICVDLERKFDSQFVPGLRGIIVGWGIREIMKPSEVLYTASLPYVSFEDCEKEVPSSFLAYLSEDKFCAGYRNGTSVCPGDGGGGFATQFKDGRWYLTGLASLGVPPSKGDVCNINQYATFVRLSDYYDFIRNNLLK